MPALQSLSVICDSVLVVVMQNNPVATKMKMSVFMVFSIG